MNFGKAIEALKQGKRCARKIWNKTFLIHEYPDGGSVEGYPPMAHGYLCLKNSQGCMEPGWTPSTDDMLAEDWQIVD